MISARSLKYNEAWGEAFANDKKGKRMNDISTQMAEAQEVLGFTPDGTPIKEITTQSPEVTDVVEEVTTPVVI